VNPEENANKTEYITLEFYMNPSNLALKYARHFIIFKDDCEEDWVKWLMAYRKIEILMTLKEPADKSKMVKMLLKGQALACFEHHLKKRVNAELSENMQFEFVMIDMGLEYIPKRAIQVQKYFMRKDLFLWAENEGANLCREA
jgi:hypothetical protein